MTIARKLRKVWWTVWHAPSPFLLLRNGCAPAIEHESVIRAVECDCVIDVGANVGQFSTLVRALRPATQLFLFEPLPAALAPLRQIFAHDVAATILPFALSTVSGEQPFHVSRRADSSSLLGIGERQIAEHRGTDEVALLYVPVRRLDEALHPERLGNRTLLKIDVQGAELDVLEGASRLLDRIRWIYCEVSFVELYAGQPLAADVITYLRSRDFALQSVTNLSRGTSGAVIQADVLFARR